MSDIEAPACLECGACCFGEGARYVPVTGDDHVRLGAFSETYTVFHGNRCYMRMEDGHCAALRIERGRFFCAVYEQRPQTCRDLARGGGACQAEYQAKGAQAQWVQLRLHPQGAR